MIPAPRSNPRSSQENDPDLQAVVAAWPALPQAIKAGIVAMVAAVENRTKTG